MTTNANKNERREQLISAILSTGRVSREALDWLTSSDVARQQDEDPVIDALIALSAQMSLSPFDQHRALCGAAWFVTNVMGLEKPVAEMHRDLATRPPDVETRRALTAKLVELRGVQVEMMTTVREVDEADRASHLVQYIAARYNHKDPADTVMALVHGIACVCMRSSSPSEALDVAAKLIAELREPLGGFKVASWCTDPEQQKKHRLGSDMASCHTCAMTQKETP